MSSLARGGLLLALGAVLLVACATAAASGRGRMRLMGYRNGGGSMREFENPAVIQMRPEEDDLAKEEAEEKRELGFTVNSVLDGSKTCCMTCRVGVPCGDRCITADDECDKSPGDGCACQWVPVIDHVDNIGLLGSPWFASTDELQRGSVQNVATGGATNSDAEGGDPSDIPANDGRPGDSKPAVLPSDNDPRTRNSFVELGEKWDLWAGAVTKALMGKSQVHERMTKAAGGDSDQWIDGVRYNDLPDGSDKNPPDSHVSMTRFGIDFKMGDPGRLIWESHYGTLQHWHSQACERKLENGKIVIFTQENILTFILAQASFWWKEALEVLMFDRPQHNPLGDVRTRSTKSAKYAKAVGHGDYFFGHVLHMIQDSYAGGHTIRSYDSSEPLPSHLNPNNLRVPARCGRVHQFEAYGPQAGNEGHGVLDHEPAESNEYHMMVECSIFYSRLAVDLWKKCKTKRTTTAWDKVVDCSGEWNHLRELMIEHVYRVPSLSSLAGGTATNIAAPDNKLPSYLRKVSKKLANRGTVSFYEPDPNHADVVMWDDLLDPLPTLSPPIVGPGTNDMFANYGPTITPLTISMGLGAQEYHTPENIRRMVNLWKTVRRYYVISHFKDRQTRRQLAIVKSILAVQKKPAVLGKSDVGAGDSYRNQEDEFQDPTNGADKDTECFRVAGKDHWWTVEKRDDADCNRVSLASKCSFGPDCNPNAGCTKHGGQCGCHVQASGNVCRCLRQIKHSNCKHVEGSDSEAEQYSLEAHGSTGKDSTDPNASGTLPPCFQIHGRSGFYKFHATGDCKKNRIRTCNTAGQCEEDSDKPCTSAGGECVCSIGSVYNDCRCIQKVPEHERCSSELLKETMRF